MTFAKYILDAVVHCQGEKGGILVIFGVMCSGCWYLSRKDQVVACSSKKDQVMACSSRRDQIGTVSSRQERWHAGDFLSDVFFCQGRITVFSSVKKDGILTISCRMCSGCCYLPKKDKVVACSSWKGKIAACSSRKDKASAF